RRTGPPSSPCASGSARGVVHRDLTRALGGAGIADVVRRAAGTSTLGGEGVDEVAGVVDRRGDLAVEPHVHLFACAAVPAQRHADALVLQREDEAGVQVL